VGNNDMKKDQRNKNRKENQDRNAGANSAVRNNQAQNPGGQKNPSR
jgi:hypothetical protein